MGKIIEKKKRKKKKGRPSLLDLQKRTLKQQKNLFKKIQKNNKIPNSQNPNPNPNFNSTSSTTSSVRRSTRRNPNPNSDGDVSKSGKKRREKKLNLVLNLPNEEDEDEDDSRSQSFHDDSSGLNLRKRKIDSISLGSGVNEEIEGENNSGDVAKQSKNQKVDGSNLVNDGPSTSLPDKSLLVFILDRLQKKDTYGVFSEPVDPEELPDYHEIIEVPMDFSTVRKKLDKGAYACLEEFEKDVFLICSNAMKYNAPDTVYFRQARSIQELAKKNFDNLRADSDDNGQGQERETEPKVVRRGRPPTKNLKRPPGRPPLERPTSNFSEATITHTGGSANRSNNDTRKSSHTEKYGSSDSLARSLFGNRYGDPYFGCSAERYERADDITGSASKGFSTKFGKKQIVLDESKRSTYMHSCALACGHESSVLSTFSRERKQLIAVGLHTEYGYARSLARFAAKIGPIAWKVASKKIERCLPSGVKFGPGWVGEDEASSERPIHQESPASVGPRGLNCDGPQGAQIHTTQKPSSEFKVKEESGNDASGTGSLKLCQTSIVQSRINGLNGSYGPNCSAQMGKIIGPGGGRPTSTTEKNGYGEAKLGNTITVKSINCLPNTESSQNDGPTQPDLNVGFQTSGSPVNVKGETKQPDLILQL